MFQIDQHWRNHASANVTRFGEISPLWQKLKCLGNFMSVNLVLAKLLSTSANFVYNWAIFMLPNWQIMKTIKAIWSHVASWCDKHCHNTTHWIEYSLFMFSCFIQIGSKAMLIISIFPIHGNELGSLRHQLDYLPTYQLDYLPRYRTEAHLSLTWK